MFTFKHTIGGSLFALLLATTTLSQENRAPIDNPREPVPAATAGPLVTATASAKRVRFVSPGTVVQLRLEVFNETGHKIFDTELHGGNVLDWHLQDGAGERLPAGSYASLLTIKSLSGRLSQRVGLVTVNDQEAAIVATGAGELSMAQQQAIGPVAGLVEGSAGFTVLQQSAAEALTTVTHDGTEGQVSRTRGALSFKVGDVFSGNDKEQMRLTEDGRLGIGTSDPQAKLDVAGTIRAERVVIAKPAKPGSVDQVRAAGDSANATEIDQPLATGSGSQDRIAKWTDNSGTLGDSAITETAGKVGIGTATPTQALEVANGRIVVTGTKTLTGPEGILEIGTTVTNNHNIASGIRLRNLYNGTANLQQALDVAPTFAPSASISTATGFVSAAFFAPPPAVTITDAFGGNAANVYSNTAGAVTNGAGFNVMAPFVLGSLRPTTQYGLHIGNQGIAGSTNSYGLYVDSQAGSTNNYSAIFAGGNVGIGTNTPNAKLDVTGNINTSTQYYIGGQRVFSASGAFNLFAGIQAGLSNTTGSFNSFFGGNSGIYNTQGNGNSFFGFTAGNGNTTGFGNSFFGYAAGVSNNGFRNAFFGEEAGPHHTTGDNNTFIGSLAGQSNTIEDNNTFVGSVANGASDITNATAVGFRAQVTQSNSLVLGSINTVNGASADTRVGIGTTAPLGRLQVVTENDRNPSFITDWDARHFVIGGTANSGGIGMSYDQGNGVGHIVALSPNSAYRNLVLQYVGGNVGIGAASPNAKLQVAGGDAAVTTQGNGLILRATNGANCFRVTVDNAGALTTTLVPCP